MKKYCLFLKDIHDENNELIWKIYEDYEITFEDDNIYYFGNPISNGISKQYKNELFRVVTYE